MTAAGRCKAGILEIEIVCLYRSTFSFGLLREVFMVTGASVVGSDLNRFDWLYPFGSGPVASSVALLAQDGTTRHASPEGGQRVGEPDFFVASP